MGFFSQKVDIQCSGAQANCQEVLLKKTRRPWMILCSSQCGSENGRVVLENHIIAVKWLSIFGADEKW